MEVLGTDSCFAFHFSPLCWGLHFTKGFVKESLPGEPGSFLHHTGTGERRFLGWIWAAPRRKCRGQMPGPFAEMTMLQRIRN